LIHGSFAGRRDFTPKFLRFGVEPDVNLSRSSRAGTVHTHSSSLKDGRLVINPRNSHTPLPDDRRKRCPICRQTVYSSAGIHPQCAIKQADPWRPASSSAPEQQPDSVEVETKAEAPVAAVVPTPALSAKRRVKQA
jgi:hypothetical protein